jgi:hypothetical protein
MDAYPSSAERAMNNDYSQGSNKRNLQLEAWAHIAHFLPPYFAFPAIL